MLVYDVEEQKTLKGDWVESSFGIRLVAPPGARTAVVSMTNNIGGLKPVFRCLPHQIYAKKIIPLIEEQNARIVVVDWIGYIREEDSCCTKHLHG